jgi:lauroyl/myristoyl acyltransferase
MLKGVAFWIARRLSERTDHQLTRLAHKLAWLFWHAFRGRRRVGLEHLELAFGASLSQAEREVLLKESYTHLALTALCALRRAGAPSPLKEPPLKIEGEEHLQQALERGGVVLLSIHLGDWEQLLRAHALLDREVVLLSKRLSHPVAHALWEASRRGAPARLDSAHPSRASQLIERLRLGGCVADVLDQHDPRPKARWLPFFGRLASTSPDALTLAERGGAQVLPIVTWRSALPSAPHERFEHVIKVGPPLEPVIEAGWPARDERLRQCLAYFEREICAHPAQWLWVHRRWKQPSPQALQRAHVHAQFKGGSDESVGH